MSQNYSNHRRYFPLHHFVVQPILIVNLFVEIARLNKYHTIYHLWLVILAIGLVLFAFSSRLMSLKAQTRVIRLEERLRLASILPAADHAIIDKLRPRQLVGLRFASDDEVADLARRCANGELTSTTEIKKSIKSWRPDYLRV